MSIKAKKALVRKSAFLKLPTSRNIEPMIISRVAHKEVMEKVIEKALMTQSASKALGPDEFNLRILRMVWEWDSKQIIAIIQNAIRLGYQLKQGKKARGILLEKRRKQNLSLVKSYRIISLLNCMGRIVEKVIVAQLLHYREKFAKLHPGQLRTQKQRCAINAVAALVHKMQKCWEKKKLAAALFLDVKRAFNHISKNRLIERMIDMGVDRDLIKWTRSLLTDQKVQLVLNRHDNQERSINTGISQGSPVSPILFLIYISEVFNKVIEVNPHIMSLSFVDNSGYISSSHSIKDIVKAFEKVAQTVVEWGNANAVTYDIAKTEAVIFSRSHCQRLHKQIIETNI